MQMRLFIPREHARVDDLNASLEAVLANNGVSPAIQGDVRLIVEELASNAIEHGDLARVEAEEHELCVDIAIREHLLTLGFDYGDFPAHDGLWEMAMRTRGDALARTATGKLQKRTLREEFQGHRLPTDTV